MNAVAMYSAEQTTYNKSAVSARDIPAGYFQYYNLGHANGEITVNPSNQAYQQTGLMSWMGRAMYSYDDKYMASVTFRADASSRLAPGHKWHTYPAISLGWNIAKEAFWKDLLPIVDQLKLRVGYGETSNQSVDPYKTLGLLLPVRIISVLILMQPAIMYRNFLTLTWGGNILLLTTTVWTSHS